MTRAIHHHHDHVHTLAKILKACKTLKDHVLFMKFDVHTVKPATLEEEKKTPEDTNINTQKSCQYSKL